ncbi:Unknown protein, partial [Striga hermonthica]
MPHRRDPEHQEHSQATVVAQFCDYQPEKFSGQGDPCIVDEWIKGLEMIFEVMDCPDQKYYPSYYRADMERQFLALIQGTRTVDEYEREFTRLGAFVPDLVGTEAKRAHRFTDGLRPAVRHNIVGHGVQTYARTNVLWARTSVSFAASQAISAPTVPNDSNNNHNNVNHCNNLNNSSPGSSHHDPSNSHAADSSDNGSCLYSIR